MKRALLAALLTCLAGSAWALEQPTVEVKLSDTAISIGEPLDLEITVLGPTWFPQAPEFPSFELPNAVVRLPPNSSRGISQRKDQALWSGVTRTYQIYPLTSGRFRLDGQQVRVVYADPGRSSIKTELTIPSIEFEAIVAPGAEDLSPYVAGRSLTIERIIDSDTDALAAGDGLVVRYVAELDGLLSLFLPPLVSPKQAPGLSVYANQPVLTDDAIARRSETLTYVFNAGGTFTLPPATLRWWNTKTGSIELATVAPLTLTVAEPPFSAGGVGQTVTQINRWILVVTALPVALVLWMLYRLASAIGACWHQRRSRYRASERFAFNALQQALNSGDVKAANHALLRWLDRLQPVMCSQQFAERFGDEQLRKQITDLRRSAYAQAQEPVDLHQLTPSLRKARHSYHQAPRALAHTSLPPLNP